MDSVRVYFAPLEGVTDPIYRRIHHRLFPGLDKYYIPFISPTQHLTMTSREQRAVSPEENAGVPAVPQILTKRAEHFVHMARLLGDAGYSEVNLNLGCPSGTVTAKGKGAGMLRDPDGLKAFLDVVYAESPVSVSIKTRIGYDSVDEWPELLDIFRQYPIHELIVHPRTRQELYKGRPHREILATLPGTGLAWAYNGDLNTAAQCRALLGEYPGVSAIMLGRGLVTNPALVRELRGGAPLSLEELREYHDSLYAAYTAEWPPSAVLGHMREIMDYICCCFEDPKRIRKALRKARSLADYEGAARRLFDECALREEPEFYFPYD